MFFSGDASSRKRVDLGGRSSKERDRNKLLEQTRFERQRRLGLRLQNAAATKIQKCFRGRKSVAVARLEIREQFISSYGGYCQNLGMDFFSPHSTFFRQLLFFFRASNHGDFDILVETCRKLLQLVRDGGDLMGIMADNDYKTNHAVVDYRLKQFSYFCLQAVHQNRSELNEQLLLDANCSSIATVILLETIIVLANPELPWVHKIVDDLVRRKAFSMLRDIILTGTDSGRLLRVPRTVTSLERVIITIASYGGQDTCYPGFHPEWTFSAQILSVPFLWHHLPHLQEVITTRAISKHYITQMAGYLYSNVNFLPDGISREFPGYACLLGNLLEYAGNVLSQSFCTRTMAVDFASVASCLLDILPPMETLTKQDSSSESDMAVDGEDKEFLSTNLEKQISEAITPCFLEHLVNSLFRESIDVQSLDAELLDEDLIAVGAICSFLYGTFSILPPERFMTVLAYRTEIVQILWNFIKRCNANQQWSHFSKIAGRLPGDAPGWLLPLAVFCPVYKHMLMIVDNEEFYEQEKPLPLKDIRCLIIILRQVLWELLWLIPGKSIASQKEITLNSKMLSVDVIKDKVKHVTSELMSQLQDWNNRRQFASFSDFHAQDAVGESFVSQALVENSKAQEILKLAPFLVPFTSRVKIFTSQLGAARQRDGHHPAFTRYRFKIRRNQILEDAYNQLRLLSEEELHGMIRVSFINEVGAEEAGIDGGGIFKDFMENVTRAGFDVQYGLFKETTDHLLYPNPGSGLIHEQHLQFFHFLGTILGKAMFEGILVDIPFATFFLSKLKQKYNYLNDLPSLDPELYRHLLFTKHYTGDVADLELYFVVVNNDYGEQTEEELIVGGKNVRVTNENVITFIHLVANYRLNAQIKNQGLHFLRGFQQLIKKEWIDMFNEHEIQLLISGSLDGMDVADLCANANYSGGYHKDHHVIEMFWEVLESFSSEYQKKFLKFVTGCSRGPLLGFNYLEPKFCIQRAAPSDASEEELDRLPTSATCMNLLKLPPYKSKEQLRTKLLYAINAEAGFDLS